MARKKREDGKNATGTPPILTPTQIQEIVKDFKEYIDKEEDPTISWFIASYPSIYSKTLKKDWFLNKDYITDHDEFSELRKRSILKQEAYLLKWWTKWTTNATVSIFRLKQPQHGYSDKQEIQHSWEIKSIHDFTYDSMNDG